MTTTPPMTDPEAVARSLRKGRTNITLEPDVSQMLERLLDRIEAEKGFRPTKHQVVSGLIRQAVDPLRMPPRVSIEDLERAGKTLIT